MNNQFRFNSSVKDIEKVNKAFNRHFAPTVKAINEWNRRIEPYANIAKNLNDRLAPVRSQSLEIQKKWDTFAKALNQEVLKNPDLLKASRQASEIARNISALQHENLSDIYSQILREYADANASGSLESSINEIEEKASSSKTTLSLEFYLTLVITLTIFLMQSIDSNEADDDLMERLDRLESTIVEKYEVATREEQNSSFYIVKANVNFREGPSTKHQVIDILYPNQKVRLMEQKQKWIKVEFYDHLEDIHREGWVYKKYLRLLNPKTPSKYQRP
ncbi:SH3 domain-containing protein [Thiohalospira halophila DSM 15071]|uniref:SH3 domain-containing protein n=1 Tax=Thiohalospira halophila DSM 15071 TaxID=1123397 RepID=A0A1I1QIC0_9GAMM|nr:SH3 domain-containing protein [Thiohalospira halophila]SFD21861.1 SH3 domain-containing protein [Thiohalospira halophila DSM 15071]